ncbi:MAG: methyltransferase family protein [Promethearchaeota archaeon]|jgi:protein-S-isoprenylcysteine O-methyltransferase Ste14
MSNIEKEVGSDKFPLLGVGPRILLTLLPFIIVFGILNALLDPLFQIPVPYYCLVIIGVVLVMTGGLVFFYSERIVKPAYDASILLTVKSYAHVRHPMYAIWGLAILPGIFMFFSSWILFLLLPIYYVIFRIFIRQEERFLLKKYGKAYAHYKKNVNAFFPKLKKYKPI